MQQGQKHILELLAPAKDKYIGIAAVDCGADAIYIAGPAFGARKDASNSIEDIAELCNYAHKFGVHVFVTLNTIVYDHEIPIMRKLIEDLQDIGVDAFIIQDLALLDLGIKLPVHASTQCSIRDVEKAKFYENLGFSRIVPERAMSLHTLKQIRKNTSVEIEFFVHGALCVCYSGQCYMSEYLNRRSANRGECSQACRSLYDLVDEQGKVIVKNKALLSLKDYKLLHRLEDLAQAGVKSFKIEGRLKNASYVKNVVREYSTALDDLVAKEPDKYIRGSWGRVQGGFTTDSNKTFNRGYTELFLDNRRGQWSSKDSPKSMGEAIGKVVKVGKGEISIKAFDGKLQLNNGDGFAYLHGSEILGFRADVCNTNRISSQNLGNIRPGMTIYRNINTAFEKELVRNMPVRLIPVAIDFLIQEQNIFISAVSDDGRKAELVYPFTEMANNSERMFNLIQSQFNKKSEHYICHLSPKSLENLQKQALPLLSAAQLNAIRRDIVQNINKENCQAIPLLHNNLHIENNLISGHNLTYKDNVANKLARKIYQSLGAEHIESAFENAHQKGVELMRMKYCIKYEVGLCPIHQKAAPCNALFLVNNGRKFPLHFDCKKCEMVVESPQ